VIEERYAAGETYRDIAGALYIAPATVRNHLAAIYRKLGVSGKPGLIAALGERTSGETGPALFGTDKTFIAVLPFINTTPMSRLA